MWNIYGKKYDLTNFIDKHPGGKDILLKTKNHQDITSLFESYHAFSNISAIKLMLNKYEIRQEDQKEEEKSHLKLYDYTNYHELTEKVKKIYPSTESVKSTPFWWIMLFINLCMYIPCFYLAMFSSMYLYYRCVLAFVAGFLQMSRAFNILHDSSHYAISVNPSVNYWLCKISNGWILWNSNIWFYHHVYNHHSYTSQIDKDPDLYHLTLFRKTKTVRLESNILKNIVKYQHYLIHLVNIPFPGHSYGQGMNYIISSFTNKLWNIDLPKVQFYDFIDFVIMSTNIYCLYNGFFLPTMTYITTVNFLYYLNTMLDHDMYETSVENHYDGNDWVRTQAENSGNFINQNKLWTTLFGGINYQIEHHLFPNMSNVHYPVIKPIVEKYCKENNIPYVHHNTLLGGYMSFLKTLKYNSID
jgi:fatty acid desaturase